MGSPGANGHRYRQLREHIKATENICHLCGDPIPQDAKWPDPLSFSLDHLEPRIFRPDLALDRGNARAAHYGCNSRRGNGTQRRRGKTPRSRRW